MSDEQNEPLDAVDWAFNQVRSRIPHPPRLPKKARTTSRSIMGEGPKANVPEAPVETPGELSVERGGEAASEAVAHAEKDDGLEILRQFMRENTVEWGESGQPSGLDGRKPRRSRMLPSLGSMLNREVRERGWENDLANGWIMGHWAELVGELNAKHTTPTLIKEGVVHVTCDSSNWATQLRYVQRQVLQKIAAKIGPDVIVELKIHGPKQHRNYEGRQYVKPQGSQDTYG